MQREELKRIRQTLGWQQEAMGDALGLSRTFVGLMERGDKAIEPRTALAARQLYDERLRFYAGHRATALADDVPIANAQIIWGFAGDDDDAEPVRVVGPGEDDDRYLASNGCCVLEWVVAGTAGQMLLLLRLFVILTVDEKIPADKVHAAFSRIPEYREAMPFGMFSDGIEIPE